MKLSNASLVALLLVACGGAQPEPAPPRSTPTTSSNATPTATAARSTVRAPKAPVALEEYYKIHRMPAFSRSGLPMASFSYDEKLVAFASDEGGRIDVWVKPVSGDAAPTQLT